MKNKNILSIIIFIVGFIVTYLIMCYCIPGLKIKLDAEPMEYFIESLKSMSLFKSVVSCIASIVLTILSFLIRKK